MVSPTNYHKTPSLSKELMDKKSSSPISDSFNRRFSVSSTGTDSTVDTAASDNESPFFKNAGAREEETKTKSVSFKSFASMRLIKCCMDYTQKETQDSWYSKDEYKKIHKDCIKQIMRMEQEQEQDDNGCSSKEENNNCKKGWCTRGLESLTRLGREQKQRVRDVAYQAVLDLQWEECADDDDCITDKMMQSYMAVSSISQMRAIAIAHCDHIAAVQAYHGDR